MPGKGPISAYCFSQSNYSAGITIGPAPDVVGPSVSGGKYLCVCYIKCYVHTYM